MRKVLLFITLSIDGYFEGPNHDLSWHNVDDEFNKFAIEQLKKTDLILFGRRTYQLMEAFWPKAAKDPTMSKENLEVANLINNVNKIVFSRTLDKVEEKENWRNVKLVHEFDSEEIRRLKEQPGKDIGVGGSDLAVSFIKAGLIDEFRFMINPVVIGEGTSIFKGINEKLNLRLLSTRTFKSGNVLLSYQPVRKGGK
ncbi:MAG: dihydrofolate reductase family protein [Nitrososphaera sp.]